MVRFDFETEEIREGKARILAPRTERGKGPGKIEGVPFYNPVMEVNRDISVLALQKSISRDSHKVLDGLSGTGIRGIRFALEVEGDILISLNDWNESCYELIIENIKLNDVQRTEVRQEDLNELLKNQEFDWVDVDPYGTPVPFVENAVRSVRSNGVLAVTATDTAALAGSYPKACKRKYDAISFRAKTSHEIGIRILIGFCARTAAEYGIMTRPLLSHSTDHYYRIYLQMQRGSRDGSLEHIGYYLRDPSTNSTQLSRDEKNGLDMAGPLWIGSLWDSGFLGGLRARSYMSQKTSRILELMKQESEVEHPYLSSDGIAQRLKTHTPRLTRLLETLRECGYSASPTHFDPKGFRTDASIERLLEIFKKL